jgi:hypothetical protein
MEKALALDSYQTDDINELIRYGIEIATDEKNKQPMLNLITAIVDQWAVKMKY